MTEKETKERRKRYGARDKDRENIREGLLDQLHDKNIYESHFMDLVNDYLSFWDVKNELIYDIESKGVSITYKNGPNQYGSKRNDSVAELNRVNGQMLTILRELGLKAEPKKVNGDEEAFKL